MLREHVPLMQPLTFAALWLNLLVWLEKCLLTTRPYTRTPAAAIFRWAGESPKLTPIQYIIYRIRNHILQIKPQK